jgi:hypothetical protein
MADGKKKSGKKRKGRKKDRNRAEHAIELARANVADRVPDARRVGPAALILGLGAAVVAGIASLRRDRR